MNGAKPTLRAKRGRSTAGSSMRCASSTTASARACGHVTRVALGANEHLALSLALWQGNPRTMAVRPLSHAFSEDPPMPVVLLSETPEEKASAIVPPRTFSPGAAAALDGLGPGAQVEAHAPVAARRRFRARRVRGIRLRRQRRRRFRVNAALSAMRYASAPRPSHFPDANRLADTAARICSSTPAIRSTGSRGTRRRWPRRGATTSRSCCRSAIRRATGAT